MKVRILEKYAEFLLERALMESTLYMSKDLMQRLRETSNKIADRLLDLSGKNIRPDATFLDIGEKDGEFTFVTMRNAKSKLSEIYPDSFVQEIEAEKGKIWAKYITGMLHDNAPEFWQSSRNPIRIGRLIRQIFPGEYTDAQVEDFVNEFKGGLPGDEEFELVRGGEIPKWYEEENCLEMKGKLGGSCMIGSPGTFFDIYSENPETCALLILKDKKTQKLTGRALIWKISGMKGRKPEYGAEYFMDRQYTIKEADVKKFTRYAKEKGWAFRTHNSHDRPSRVTFNGEELIASMTAQVKPGEYGKYPYMDTFKRYNKETGTLHNDEDGEDGEYQLTCTNGEHHVFNRVWSDWHESHIPRERAVWSDELETYLDIDSACEVELGRGSGFYPINYTGIVRSSHDGYLHKQDCVYSDTEGQYIYEPKSVTAIVGKGGGTEVDFVHQEYADEKCKAAGLETEWFAKTLSNPELPGFKKTDALKRLRQDIKDGLVKQGVRHLYIANELCAKDGKGGFYLAE